MKYSSSPDLTSLSPGQAVEINRVCDCFEEALRASRRPSLEEAVTSVAQPMRAALLLYLLAAELEYRRSIGKRPDVTEYRRRFPEYAAVVEAAFGRLRETQGASHASDHGMDPTEGTMAEPDRIAPARAATALIACPRDLFDHPDYEILRELGKGGLGVVYHAHNRVL